MREWARALRGRLASARVSSLPRCKVAPSLLIASGANRQSSAAQQPEPIGKGETAKLLNKYMAKRADGRERGGRL